MRWLPQLAHTLASLLERLGMRNVVHVVEGGVATLAEASVGFD